uniref:Chromosome 21 open reading frame 58 n=1 Tax=Leptobrachium leishanense TaxID=445787 RepID=A0A8C5WEK6_9ANUR
VHVRDSMKESPSEPDTRRSYDGQEEALQSALRRRKDLLHRLREQHLLEEITRPHTWEGSRRPKIRAEPLQPVAPVQYYQTHPNPEPPMRYYPPPPPPEPPRIIQQQLPQQPTTIIQQLPAQQPLITQIPSSQTFQPPRSGSIKEDMVEMMLMQNAQMHQIIMQNMMLKALPPLAMQQPAANTPQPQVPQDSHFAGPVVLRADKIRPSSVHHHHHYTPPNHPPLPPTMQPGPGYPMWSQMMPSNTMGHFGGFPPTIHHVTGPTSTLPINCSNQLILQQASKWFMRLWIRTKVRVII